MYADLMCAYCIRGNTQRPSTRDPDNGDVIHGAGGIVVVPSVSSPQKIESLQSLVMLIDGISVSIPIEIAGDSA